MDEFEPRLRVGQDEEPEEPEKDGEKAAKAEDKNRAVQKILFDSRTVLLFGEVDEKLARDVISQLLALGEASRDTIRLVISSPGGHVESGDAIHDMIRFVGAPVKAIGTGWVASAGAHIFLAAEKENRYCTPNTRFLLHQPMGGVGGRATDIDIEAREILKMRERLNRVFAERTGQSVERIAEDTRRNFWLDAKDAKKYGLVGRIIRNVAELD